MNCKTVEPFPDPNSILGPQRVNWKKDEMS